MTERETKRTSKSENETTREERYKGITGNERNNNNKRWRKRKRTRNREAEKSKTMCEK